MVYMSVSNLPLRNITAPKRLLLVFMMIFLLSKIVGFLLEKFVNALFINLVMREWNSTDMMYFSWLIGDALVHEPLWLNNKPGIPFTNVD